MKTKLLKLLVVMTISITALFALGMTASAATEYDVSQGSVVIETDGEYIITGTTTTNSITVASGVDATITLDGVNIDVSATGELNTGNVDASKSGTPAFKIADDSTGDVTIILADGSENVLKSGVKCAGLQKNGEYTADLGMLTIKGGELGTGKLTATGGCTWFFL